MEELLFSAIECTWVSDHRQTEIYTAEPLVTEPSPFEDKIAITKFNRHTSPGNYQILAEIDLSVR
jgi:hypothetical protein